MNDIKELNDEELEKVSGGVEYGITRVDAGDVFISKQFDDDGYIVTNTTIIDSNTKDILCKRVSLKKGIWVTEQTVLKVAKSLLMSDYEYSAELTGTINYL